jgi:hypothetical protein
VVAGSALAEIVTAALTAAASLLAASLAAWRSSRATTKQENRERQRLTEVIFGPPLVVPTTDATNKGVAALLAIAKGTGDGSAHDTASVEQPPVPTREEVYDKLLIEDYALGMAHARRAFNASMAFSVLGGIVLVFGVALAIFRVDTGGQIASAVITSLAGVLTTGLSQLFRDQSAKALKHLESQAVELRKDVRAQTNAATALRLLEEIDDPELRSRLQAALILEFTGAKLPDLNKPHSPSANGQGHNHKSEDLASSS